MAKSIRELADELYVEQIREARRMSPADKLAMAGILFEEVCQRMRDGIRSQFPNVGDEQVERILRQRLDIARRLEQC